MANANDTATLTRLRLEELIRILDLQNAESYERKRAFREKLESLKERQENIQRRRVSRLENEGIHIDLNLIKRHEAAPRCLKRLDIETENEMRRNTINDKLRELFKSKETTVEAESDYDNESENETDVEIQQIENNFNGKQLSKLPLLESSELDQMAEDVEEESFDNENSTTDNVKTVQVRVKKHNTKRSVKAIGHVVTTTKYLSKMSSKSKKSMNKQK